MRVTDEDKNHKDYNKSAGIGDYMQKPEFDYQVKPLRTTDEENYHLDVNNKTAGTAFVQPSS